MPEGTFYVNPDAPLYRVTVPATNAMYYTFFQRSWGYLGSLGFVVCYLPHGDYHKHNVNVAAITHASSDVPDTIVRMLKDTHRIDETGGVDGA